MEDKPTIEYKVTITTPTDETCISADPLGLCTPTDCMTCKYSKVKIVREDNVVMRDDYQNKDGINAGYDSKYRNFKYRLTNNPATFLEEFLGLKLSYW